MKYKLILIFLSLGFLLKAQAPQYMNYQGVARNSSGTIINSGNVGLKFEILQGSTAVYSEEQSASPSAAGIFTAAIGSGTNVSGSFSSINWANGPYSIRVSLDPSGGTSFTNVGTSQLLSVPYSLYAEKAGSVNLSSGTGISISSGSIINTAPNQTVNITGANVTGTYPDYTITAAPSTSYSAGTGISVTGSVIANTAPDQTVTLVAAGISSVTGTYPSYVIDVPPPALSYNNTTNELTLTQGTVVSTATLTASSSGSVSITGPNVTGSYPNYTITAVPVTSITSGNSNISVTGTAPNYTISSNPLLTLTGNSLSISNGNTVTLPTGTTYSNGPGISITSGTLITNAAPDQTVTIGSGINTNVTGTYPNFVVNATPSLSIAGNTLSITGGTSVVLPSPPVLLAGAGIAINSGSIINTAPDQNVTLTGVGATTVGGTYPNFTIGTPPPTPVTITGTGAAGVTTSGNNFTVNVPNPTYNNNTGAFVTGTNTISVVPSLNISGNTLSSGPFSNSVTIPSYTAGAGLVLTGVSPNFTLGTTSNGTNTAWSTLGNTGTNPTLNFIGTTDNNALNFRVNNAKAGRIDPTGQTFFGFNAGANNLSIYNTGVGFNVLNANTTGSLNTAIGYAALDANTTGTDNTALGFSALGTNATGIFNTAVGSNALGLNSNGVSNTGVGAGALYNNSTGSQNTAAGSGALYSNITGVSNSAFGVQALNNNTHAGNNVAVGAYALNGQSYGAAAWNSDNVAVGYQALYSNNPTATVNGIKNSALGSGAMLNNTTGFENTSLGYQSLFSNTIGTWNTVVGGSALYSNISGNRNFAGANGAMYDNTSGNDNTAIGYTAMRYNKTGSSNTIYGSEAGFGVSGQSYSNNTLIGRAAGYSLATGSGNVFLGYQAGYSETGSNKLYIANSNAAIPLIYGDFSSNMVGIGTNAPSHVLELASSSTAGLLKLKTNLANTQITMDDGSANDVYLTTTNGDFNIWTGGTQRVNVTTTGFVGMGTTTPGQQLHIFSSGTNVGLAIDGGVAGRARLGFLPGGVDNGEIGFKNDLTFGTVANSSLIMSTELMRLTSTGRLGIGTTAPANKLHVNGGVTITDGTQGLGKIFTSDASGNGQWKPSQIAFFSGGNPTSTTVNYSASQTATLVFNSGTSSLAYNNGGGYGTSTGVFTAPVAGVYQFDAVCVFAGATSGYVQLKMRHSSGNLIAEQEGFFNSVGQNWFSGKLAATVHLNAGEKVAIEYYAGTGGGSTFYQDKSSFSGHLVYAD